MAIDAAKMLLGEQPSRSHPSLNHIGITPARNVSGSTLYSSLGTLDDVGRRQTFVERFRNLQTLQSEHLLDGKILGRFGRAGKLLNEFGTVHKMDCRNPSEIYAGELTGKCRPRR